MTAQTLTAQALTTQARTARTATAAPGPVPATVAALIADRARCTPHAPALRCGATTLTYQELDRRSRRLAARLRRAGVGPEVPVGIQLRRSPELAVTIAAVLRAGGACVPLDPAYPRQRLALVLAGAACPIVLTSSDLLPNLPDPHPQVLLVDGCAEVGDAENGSASDDDDRTDGRADASPRPDNLAWVAFTSGSTGRPKGVPLSHGPLAALASGIAARLELTGQDRVLQFASIGFSVAAEEVLSTWLAGACLVMDPAEELADSARLSTVIERERVSVLQLTPSYWYEWMRELAAGGVLAAPPSLRLLVVGSEPVSPERVADWCATGVRLVQEYGATEATVSQLLYEQTPADPEQVRGWERLPIGTPLPGVLAYVLDERMAPVTPGEIGELYLGGPGVSRGYLGLPGMTADRFLPDPFSAEPGGRIYRTRDLVRRLPGGEMEFLGRVDYQLNIRGVRIEPGEVEQAVCRFPGVADAAVLSRADASGADQLVACVAWSGSGEPAERALRAFLRDALPAALVPVRFLALPALPLNANGKVDRHALRALPWPEADLRPCEPAPARDEWEAQLLAVWQQVLGTGPLGVEDDFFELGGDSLRATRLAAEIRAELGADVTQRMLFETPTVAGLAAAVRRRQAPGPEQGAVSAGRVPVPSGAVPSTPASSAQRQLWLMERLAPGSARFNEPVVLRLTGSVDREALQRALEELVARHSALRTVFAVEDGLPVQQVAGPGPVPLPLVDLAGAQPGATAPEEAVQAAVAELVREPFDLARGPLLRAALLRTGPDRHLLVLTVHHIVFDGQSMEILYRELGALYRPRRTSAGALPPLDRDYADYARRQHRQAGSPEFAAQLAYWRQRLAGVPVATRLPSPLPPPSRRTGAGAVLRFQVPPRTAVRLRELAGTARTSTFTVLLAAFYEQVHRATGAADLVIGTLASGRDRPEWADVVGVFINTLCLRTTVAPGARFRRLLADTRETVREAVAHQDVPFERLVEELGPPRGLPHSPLVQLLLSYGSTPGGAPELSGLTVEPVPVDTGTAKFDATLALDEEPDGGLRGVLEYDLQLFDAAAARQLVDGYLAVLAEAPADPDHLVAGA